MKEKDHNTNEIVVYSTPNSTAEEMATVLAVRNMNCDQNDKESMFKSKTLPHIKSCLISYRFNFRVQNLASS